MTGGRKQADVYRVRSKWVRPDGKTMYLVFSGRTRNGRIYDAFCVRKMALQTAND